MRTKPPGMTCQPSPSRASNSRRLNGRGTSWPFSQTGVVESVTASCATKSMPRRPIASTTLRARSGIEILADHDLPIDVGRNIAGEGRRDHQIVEPLHDIVAHGGIAEPPGRDVRQRQFAAEHRRRQRRQEAQHGARFDHAGAQRIGHHHGAVADRLHQTGHAQPRAGAQLQRIGEIGIEAAQQHLGALQTGHGANEHAVVADGQVLAFDQQKAEIAREIGVLEIGLVHRPGRQHADRRIVAAAERRQLGLERLEERRDALDPKLRDRCRASRATARAGSPAHSPRPTAPGCGRRAPTIARPASGRHRRHRTADARRPAARCRPAAARNSGLPATTAAGRRPSRTRLAGP